MFTFSPSIFLKSQWQQASKTLKNVVNYVKPALHVTKICYISLTNIHSFMLQTKHFHWSSRYSCLGNCLIWKVNLHEKTYTLHSWTQMVVKSLEDLATNHKTFWQQKQLWILNSRKAQQTNQKYQNLVGSDQQNNYCKGLKQMNVERLTVNWG